MNMLRAVCMAVAFMKATAVLQANRCSSVGECPSNGEPQNMVSLLQSQLNMNVLEVGGEKKAMLQSDCAERKLVINSHVKYGKALDRLVASLKEHNFPLNDCVVFRGGAPVLDTLGGPRIGTDNMTFVDLAINSFDLNAFAGLSMYKNHPLVCADMYFYIHDSAEIGPCFPQVFNEIKVAPTEVITPGQSYFSNQCAFGRSVVDKFGDDFQPRRFVSIGKSHGFEIEKGGCYEKACSIDHYAEKQTVIPARVDLGELDVYHTSMPRKVEWYQEWDLYKFYLFQESQNAFTDDLNVRKPALVQQGSTWAQSCPRKCTLEGSNSPLCRSSADA